MSDHLTTTLEDEPSPADVHAVSQGLLGFNRDHVGDDDYRPLAVFLRDDRNAIAGGLVGATYWSWLSVATLWVRDDLRGRGHGGRLLHLAEQEAIRRGCIGVHLNTLAYQAPAFYRKRGYTPYGELPDFVGGHAKIYLTKRLVPPPDHRIG